MLINVLIEHNSIKQTFTYQCIETVEKGCRVRVEFLNRILVGFVEEINVVSYLENIKPVIEVIDKEPLLNNELMLIADYMSKECLASKVSCYKTMLPPALRPETNHFHIVYENMVYTNSSEEVLTQKQEEFLKNHIYPVRLSELRKESVSITNSLIKKGYFLIKQQPKESVITMDEIEDTNHSLTDEQVNAIHTIQNGNNSVFLLHGVTGSGKTEVFLHLAQEVLNQGKQVLFLVPEIGLTPMMIQRVQARFKQKIAIYHSRLSAQEKYTQYKLVKDNEVDIVVGTRSACFMPFKNLGLILMDEEHDTSYKQDNTPRYHTRDIALFRASYHHCKIVLASATPSLESYSRAYKNLYTLVELKKRIHSLPDIQLIDMKKEKVNSGLSLTLIEGISQALEKKEQVILLLNRRGYLPIVRCSDCGHVRVCPECGVALTYHKSNHVLMCHCCGQSFYFDEKCPNCQSTNYFKTGMGTEKLEEEIYNLFSGAHIVRMDADSTRKKNAHANLLKEFSSHGDILLGTQMVSKGLDFERVTLVGILNADATLARNDYRASETAYEMLEQASGRSGRGAKLGRVMIQTFDPMHYVMQCIYLHNYQLFFKQEMKYRHLGNYPPFVYLCSLVFSHTDITKAMEKAQKAKEYFVGLKVLGPIEIGMRQKRKRVRIILKCKDDQKLHKIVDEYLKSTKDQVDVDMHPLMLEE